MKKQGFNPYMPSWEYIPARIGATAVTLGRNMPTILYEPVLGYAIVKIAFALTQNFKI